MAYTAIPSPYPLIVHPISSQTPESCAFEHSSTPTPNALIFIGGLTSGPHTTPFVRFLANQLVEGIAELGFTVWEFRMRSSYTGFGYSSLAKDVEDMSSLVKYLRKIGKEKIVLMGMSTGCQDCLEYTNHAKYNNPSVDGYILVSPVSDREMAAMLMPKEYLEETIFKAKEMIADGKQEEAMPKELIPPVFSSPVTAYRWNSLAAKGGDDDYFSSDLGDVDLVATFGRVDKPILMMPSQADESVPPAVDKQALLDRWIKACPKGLASPESSLNPGADHAVRSEAAQTWLSKKTVLFLRSL